VGEDYGVLLSSLTPQNYFNNTNSIYYDSIKVHMRIQSYYSKLSIKSRELF
jgi:hypothetical protein